ncbi:hypothetical protein MIT9_P2071 [Methylomarinovum caldicuralii]|uniref:PepSY domain-containing protein n=2 Tax=Methylomarinovum caldicuralii TaxID=438856 RepID=A0AAU9C5H2_9GAMM|nr:hypothetical protein MIT9_P2071 [Methylomarinovum caldicuralii]
MLLRPHNTRADNMKYKSSLTCLFTLAAFSGVATAADKGIDSCIDAISKQQAGEIVKVEKVTGNGKTLYEFEVRDANGFEWEFMCGVDSGKIVEQESEVRSPESLTFRQGRKYTEEDAAAVALKSYPGVIQEVEYEIEEDSSPTYEFDIVGKDGKQTKVEVDAKSGKIIEVWNEEWEIGQEPEERR